MKNERLGLVMIVASLVAVLAVALLVARRDSAEQRLHQRAQGVTLTRVLAGIPFEALLGEGSHPALLRTLLRSHPDREFAYGVLVDPKGVSLAEVASAGLSAPPFAAPAEPALWNGERVAELGPGGPRVREFHAPVLSGGQLRGFVRIGYVDDEAGSWARHGPFFALLALPVFLLVPLFYWLVQREVRPLVALEREVAERSGTVEPARSEADLRAFVERLGAFVRTADEKLRALERQNSDAVTSGRLLGYRKERVESVLHALPDGVLVLDESGVATFANAKVGPLAGLDAESVVGRHMADWGAAPEFSECLATLRERCGSEGRHARADFRPGHDESRRVTVFVHPLAAPRDPGRRLGTLVVMRDTTDELLAAEARDEFIAHVSHELKTPLGNIVMCSAQLVEVDDLPEAERVASLNAIHDEAERMTALIGNLLSIAKIEAGSISVERARVRLHDLLEDSFDAVQHSPRVRAMRLSLDLPAELSPVIADKDLLRIALNNLLSNAVKYNRPDGEVVVSAEESEDEVVIRVRDTGIGIAPADIPHVFDKFYRSGDREAVSRGGHGLGLYLVRQIVELHHGRVEVQSTPGVGTQFTIVLGRTQVMLREAA